MVKHGHHTECGLRRRRAESLCFFQQFVLSITANYTVQYHESMASIRLPFHGHLSVGVMGQEQVALTGGTKIGEGALPGGGLKPGKS